MLKDNYMMAEQEKTEYKQKQYQYLYQHYSAIYSKYTVFQYQ